VDKNLNPDLTEAVVRSVLGSFHRRRGMRLCTPEEEETVLTFFEQQTRLALEEEEQRATLGPSVRGICVMGVLTGTMTIDVFEGGKADFIGLDSEWDRDRISRFIELFPEGRKS
jgi:hypothetical protein